MFCWAVKSGEYHRDFYIDKASGRLNITRNNFNLVRPTFGEWVARRLPGFSNEPLILVPVPNKAALSDVATYRTLEMAEEALKGTAYADNVVDALRWDEQLKPAHEGGPRSRDELYPHLVARPEMELDGKNVVLIDDLFTTGASLLACEERLIAEGAMVFGAITCGRTVYDTSEAPAFGARDFELTEELSDYRAPDVPPAESP